MKNNIENENDYLNRRKMAEELSDLLLGRSESDEETELGNFLRSEERRAKLIDRLRNNEKAEAIYHAIAERDQRGDVNRLVNLLTEDRIRRQRRRLIASVVSGAAALITLFVMVYDFGKEETQRLPVAAVEEVKKEIELVKTLPVLKYDNSDEEIVLGTQENISISGHHIGNVKENKLEYVGEVKDTLLYATLAIPEQTKYTVVLYDGTEVCLNANSRLRYPSKFGNVRDVELDGEAYFKVAKSEKPFIVKVCGVEVKVYGTEFNITAYDSSRVVTTLVTGSVGVKYNQVEKRIKPRDRITINSTDSSEVMEHNVNVEKYKSWAVNYFRCDEEPLCGLLEELSNWYGVTFAYTNAEIMSKTISASLENSLKIDDVLKILELSSSVKFIKKGGVYVVE